LWLSIAHVALPLGSTGVRELPNEDAVIAVMKANVPEAGFYFYPGGGMTSAKTPEEKKAAQAAMTKKMEAGPWGILIFNPNGTAAISPRQLLTELAANLVEAMLAVWLISLAPGLSFVGRICFGATIGLAGGMMTNISYWNWYGFPSTYTAMNLFIQVTGFAVVGLVASLMLRRSAVQMVGAGK
jgi:hypothetical protein